MRYGSFILVLVIKQDKLTEVIITLHIIFNKHEMQLNLFIYTTIDRLFGKK